MMSGDPILNRENSVQKPGCFCLRSVENCVFVQYKTEDWVYQLNIQKFKSKHFYLQI